jgi:hypothetical protein
MKFRIPVVLGRVIKKKKKKAENSEQGFFRRDIIRALVAFLDEKALPHISIFIVKAPAAKTLQPGFSFGPALSDKLLNVWPERGFGS